ncbi:neuronal acetylcholine receptor subunit alpha-6-like [Haliotis rufescens]|uniref:neuronal acetylcholine receptor subunit alpha-6-like n=1 Tax=Haliotis rufescens TaxID=6454 RepID=UPI00201EE094|nr:neuronal acetylcholine receptor subunit alpha-6-like [Haliotis rufescens]
MATLKTSVLLILSVLYTCSSSFSIEGETLLRKDLLTNYSTYVRPTPVTSVEIAYNLLSIQNMNLQDQQMSFAGWFTLVWEDPRLSWTPASYNNVSDIHTDSHHIWYPVLVVDNAVDDLSPIEDKSIPMRVTEHGLVRWTPPRIITTACDMDPTFFPFDRHTCSIEITSFGYTLGEVNLTVRGAGMVTDFYQKDGLWEMLDHASSRSVFIHDGDGYARIQLQVTMRRLPSYHGLNLILPVLINSILVAFVFKLSPKSGEKMGFSLTVLLAYTVILTILADAVPSTSVYTSVLEVYVSAVLILSTLGTVISVFSQVIYFRESSCPIPPWVVCFSKCMARVLFWEAHKFKPRTKPCNNNVLVSQAPDTTRLSESKIPKGWDTPFSISTDDPEDLVITWKDVSLMIDSFCFWVFLVAIGILSILSLSVIGAQY